MSIYIPLPKSCREQIQMREKMAQRHTTQTVKRRKRKKRKKSERERERKREKKGELKQNEKTTRQAFYSLSVIQEGFYCDPPTPHSPPTTTIACTDTSTHSPTPPSRGCLTLSRVTEQLSNKRQAQRPKPEGGGVCVCVCVCLCVWVWVCVCVCLCH